MGAWQFKSIVLKSYFLFMLSLGDPWEGRGRGSVIVPESEAFTKIHENRRKRHRIQRGKSPAYCFYKPAAFNTMNLAQYCFVMFSEKQSPWLRKEWLSEYWPTGRAELLTNQNEHCPVRIDISCSSQSVHAGACLLPLVIAEATENTEREPQISESPVLPELNLFYTNRCILN